MLEGLIIKHCAPTLAGLKTANLFNCRNKELMKDFYQCRENLNKKGIDMAVLTERENSVLIYVYRKDRLAADLSHEKAAELLTGLGYKAYDADSCISRLCRRMKENDCFPHEIGLFLGYPVEDVRGFIEHKGRDFKCMGFWKVYCNEYEARKTFAKYKKCIEVYTRMYTDGRSLEKLTVAV